MKHRQQRRIQQMRRQRRRDAIEGIAIAGDAIEGIAIAGDAIEGIAIAGDAIEGVAIAGDLIAGDAIAGVAIAGETAQTQTRTPNHHHEGEEYSKAAGENHETEHKTVCGSVRRAREK